MPERCVNSTQYVVLDSIFNKGDTQRIVWGGELKYLEYAMRIRQYYMSGNFPGAC